MAACSSWSEDRKPIWDAWYPHSAALGKQPAAEKWREKNTEKKRLNL